MKRFHVHVSVESLQESIGFYSHLFGSPPSVEKEDYAKWMLEDPRINFAISTRGGKPGVDHLGIQADSAGELGELKARAQAAEIGAHHLIGPQRKRGRVHRRRRASRPGGGVGNRGSDPIPALA